MTKSDIEGRGVHTNSDITTTKNMHTILILLVFGQLDFGMDSSGGVI